ncbi:MAG: Ig-like domain-containing protein [Clostridia bacterium]|nr:Ig-like domain-containing protein [Clostridia bacterium]
MKNHIIRNILLMIIIVSAILVQNCVFGANELILGDINKDEKIDSIDLLYMMRHIVAENDGNHKEWILEDEKYKLADITQNGIVNSSDLLVILRYIAANNNPEEIGKKHKEWLEVKEIESQESREENNILKSEDDIEKENTSKNTIEITNTIEVSNEIIETNSSKIEPDLVNNTEIEKTKSEVKAINLNKSVIEIEKGTTEQIIATIEPKELNNEKIEWKIANTQIAEVDETGKITAKKNGDTLLTARTTNGKEAVSKVRVGTYPKSIEINKEIVKMDLSGKRTEKVEVIVKPDDASNKEVKVDNKNERVATIDGEGKITAKENGETELTFKTANGIEKKLKVKVETSATGVKLDKNYIQLDLSKNKQSTIKATIEPGTTSNKGITYKSSNAAIATVDKNGKITAKGNGTANIIARTANGKEAVCKVEVQTVATKINMDKKVSIDLSKNTEKKIKVEVKPDSATNKSVMIRSDNEAVATIDSSGTIKAKKNGTATITAQIAGTDIVETCKVTVTTSPTGLKMSKTNVKLDMSGTKSIKITAEVQPSTASNKKIKWTNGNSNIVYMSASGKTATITGLKNGEATIIAEIEGTNIKKTIKVTVTTSPTKITLNKTSETLDMSGAKTVQLKAKVEPSTAENKTVTWSSDNTKVATVDKNGKVTGKNEGIATITAKTHNGKKDTFKITINSTKISLDRTILMIDNTHYNIADLQANLSSTAIYKGDDITWTISNSSVAKFNKDGKKYSTIKGSAKVQIVGLSFGTAKITVKIPNGKTATCNLKVITSSKEQSNGDRSYYFSKGHGINNNMFYLRSGTWGNEYVEAYVDNIAKIVKKYQDTKFKDEAAAKKLYCYEQKSMSIITNNNTITNVSGKGYPYTTSVTPYNNGDFRKIIKNKAKGEITPNDYILLFTSKNQWAYLLKRNKKGNWKVVSANQSSGGYERDQFERYLCIKWIRSGIGLSLTDVIYSETASVYQNLIHTGQTPGVPTSAGCIHLAGSYQAKIYYRLFVEAGVGTRFILF